MKSYNRKKETFKDGVRRRYLAAFDETVERLRITESKVCAQMKIKQPIISEMRAGTRWPTLEHIVIICDTYDYDLEFMIRGKVAPGSRRPAPGATIEMVYEELQDLKEVSSELLTKMLDVIITAKKGNFPKSPEEWRDIFNKS